MCELLEKAREAQGNISYWEIARRLKVSDQVMNKWKNNKSQPNGINTLKLAEMAKLMPSEAIKLVERGYANLSILIMTAWASTLALASFLTVNKCILC